MIRINKSATVPATLAGAGAIETADLCLAYAANPAAYTSAPGLSPRLINKMNFVQGVYGDQTVKNQLEKDQHYKCCFCEGKFSEHSYGDVEHFRPKKAYKKHGQKKLNYPGYYWLAYDWNNLMYSCEKCNRTYKRSDFPLQNEATRSSHHAHANPIANEDCLLINPIIEDPSQFITFDKGIPKAVNSSLKGKVSIEKYGLDRLNHSRIENLSAIRCALILSNIDETDAAALTQAEAALNIAIPRNELVQSIIDSKSLRNSAAKDTAKFAQSVRCEFPFLPSI
jgi:uncharacterized protein (TIGR02646 family)